VIACFIIMSKIARQNVSLQEMHFTLNEAKICFH